MSRVHQLQVDSGSQDIQKLYPASAWLPFKSSKTQPITKAQKKHNHCLAVDRVVIEHVIRALKILNILAYPYSNRRKRFLLRLNLIVGFFDKMMIASQSADSQHWHKQLCTTQYWQKRHKVKVKQVTLCRLRQYGKALAVIKDWLKTLSLHPISKHLILVYWLIYKIVRIN